MFESIYTGAVTPAQFFLTAAVALVSGVIYAWVMSFRIRSTQRFFIVSALIPFTVAAVITFVNGNIGAGVAIGGAFGLIRFRSAQGSADEIAAILIAMGAGIAFGMGYLGYGVAILVCLAVLFLLLSAAPVFTHGGMAEDQLLRITIPESLEYNGAFAVFEEGRADGREDHGDGIHVPTVLQDTHEGSRGGEGVHRLPSGEKRQSGDRHPAL